MGCFCKEDLNLMKKRYPREFCKLCVEIHGECTVDNWIKEWELERKKCIEAECGCMMQIENGAE
jgi:hypothetical protein